MQAVTRAGEAAAGTCKRIANGGAAPIHHTTTLEATWVRPFSARTALERARAHQTDGTRQRSSPPSDTSGREISLVPGTLPGGAGDPDRGATIAAGDHGEYAPPGLTAGVGALAAVLRTLLVDPSAQVRPPPGTSDAVAGSGASGSANTEFRQPGRAAPTGSFDPRALRRRLAVPGGGAGLLGAAHRVSVPTARPVLYAAALPAVLHKLDNQGRVPLAGLRLDGGLEPGLLVVTTLADGFVVLAPAHVVEPPHHVEVRLDTRFRLCLTPGLRHRLGLGSGDSVYVAVDGASHSVICANNNLLVSALIAAADAFPDAAGAALNAPLTTEPSTTPDLETQPISIPLAGRTRRPRP